MRKRIWILIFAIMFSGISAVFIFDKDNHELAIELKNKGDLQDGEEAISTYTEAINLDENYTAAYCKRGLIKTNLGDVIGGLEDQNKALQIDSNYVNSYCARAIAKGKLNDNYGAIADLCKAIELDSNNIGAYLNLAYRYNKVGNHEEELETYKKGLDVCRKNPNPLFYINYGTSLLEQELINEGIDIYTEGINTFSDNKELYLRRGVAYMMRDNPDDRVYALLDFTQSYELGHEKALDMINRLHSY
ncbi:MAG: hypothetical protein R3Y22_09620 [Bacteroidales bacterium]